MIYRIPFWIWNVYKPTKRRRRNRRRKNAKNNTSTVYSHTRKATRDNLSRHKPFKSIRQTNYRAERQVDSVRRIPTENKASETPIKRPGFYSHITTTRPIKSEACKMKRRTLRRSFFGFKSTGRSKNPSSKRNSFSKPKGC